MNESENPYAAPLPEGQAPPEDRAQTEAEAVRRRYVRREAMIRSLGFFYYFGAACMAIICYRAVCRTGVSIGMLYEFAPRAFWLYAFCGFLVVLSLLTGWGLRRLAPWARVPVAFSTMGLFSFPIGTGVNLLVLYVVFSPAAWTVFSPEYRDVIHRTPHIRYPRLKLVLLWCGFVAWCALLTAAAWAWKRAS